MDGLTLPLDAFVGAIGVDREVPHAMLGAGTSISSEIPSAGHCIWEWKRKIFLTNNPGVERQFSELSLLSVQRRIQGWLDKQGGLGSPTFCPSDGVGAVEHRVECHPSAPQHKPPRTFITSAVLVSAKAG